MASDIYDFTSGHYTAALGAGSTNIGTTREGFTIIYNYLARPVLCDEFGEGEVRHIHAGVNIFVELDYVEYDLMHAALHYNAGGASIGNPYADVGRDMTFAASLKLVLTPVSRNDNVRIWTFHRALIVGDVEILLSSKLREGPARFQCFPEWDTDLTEREYFTITT